MDSIAIEAFIKKCATDTRSREDFWIEFLKKIQAEKVAEIGVFRGDFASLLLANCDAIQKYYMVDPWRHLENWDKPANKTSDVFEQFLLETKQKTDFALNRRVILRGKTSEVIDGISEGELDFAYIDGDHTLKGITIDLLNVYSKVKEGGYIAGDDFTKTIWQHKKNYEPTMVFPFAVYFSEAVNVPIYALPNSQFLIRKSKQSNFKFNDLTGRYDDLSLKHQFYVGSEVKQQKSFASIFNRLLNCIVDNKK